MMWSAKWMNSTPTYWPPPRRRTAREHRGQKRRILWVGAFAAGIFLALFGTSFTSRNIAAWIGRDARLVQSAVKL